jgi:hypothetical protein
MAKIAQQPNQQPVQPPAFAAALAAWPWELDYVEELPATILSAADKLAYQDGYRWSNGGQKIITIDGLRVGKKQGSTRGLDRIKNLLQLGVWEELPYRQDQGPLKGQFRIKVLVGKDLFVRLEGLRPVSPEPQREFDFPDDAARTFGPAGDDAAGDVADELRLLAPCASPEGADGCQGLSARVAAAPGSQPPSADAPAQVPAEVPARVLAKVQAEATRVARAPLTLNTSCSQEFNSTSHLGTHLPYASESESLLALARGGSSAIGNAGTTAGTIDEEEADLHRQFRQRRAEAEAQQGESQPRETPSLAARVEAVLEEKYSPAAQHQRVDELVGLWQQQIRDPRMYRDVLVSLAWDVVEHRIPQRCVDKLLRDMRRRANNRSSFINGGIKRLRHQYAANFAPQTEPAR